jgi:uncharacterized protein
MSDSKQKDWSLPSIPLLSAYWRYLIVINYQIDPALLKPLVPPGTQLDYYQKKTFISLVGFLFQNTKLFGLIPLLPFQNFEEINLRFYIRKKVGNEIRRAVCFIREIVPYAPIAWGARVLYNEPYAAYPTGHLILQKDVSNPQKRYECTYEWKMGEKWVGLTAQTTGNPQSLRKKSIEEFILEHYWGYTRQKDGSVKEYQVQHEPWRYWSSPKVTLDKAVPSFYGDPFSRTLSRKPHSAFVAEGSPVSIYTGRKV